MSGSETVADAGVVRLAGDQEASMAATWFSRMARTKPHSTLQESQVAIDSGSAVDRRAHATNFADRVRTFLVAEGHMACGAPR